MFADLDESLQSTLGDTTESLKSTGDTTNVILEVVVLLLLLIGLLLEVGLVCFRKNEVSTHTHTQLINVYIPPSALRFFVAGAASAATSPFVAGAEAATSPSPSIVIVPLSVVSVPSDNPQKKHFQTNQG